MKKSVEQLLAIVDDIAPELKASQRLFIVDLIIIERHKSWMEAMGEVEEEEIQATKEEKEHYADYSDQPDYSEIKEDFDNREDDR